MSYPSGGAHCHVLQGRLAKHLKKIRYRTRTATRAIFAKTGTSHAWVWLSEGSASGAHSWGWGREASRCSPQLGTSASTRDLQGLQRPQSRHAAIIPSVQQAPSLLCFLQESGVLLSPGLSDSTKNARSSALFELASSSLHLAIGKFIYVPFLLIDYIY